jgi:uncharacterized repeat protein (TIGR03803 family)
VFQLTPDGRETVLHSFAAGTDGANPQGGLTMDAHRNLFGTTYSGGDLGVGTVFKLRLNGQTSVLHSFGHGKDGANPYSGLLRDVQGNLYGTTSLGGANNLGTIFKVSRNGTETVMHSFARQGDGTVPHAGLIADSQGNLYGATFTGGNNGTGTVLKLPRSGQESVLYSFGAFGSGDGASPTGLLTMDDHGNLVGTTPAGGMNDKGTIFEIQN